MKRAYTLLLPMALSSLLLTAHSQPASNDTVVAVDWHPRESTSLHKKIDDAVIKYAEALSNSAYSETGGRTLQALGLVAALPRLPESLRKDYLAKAIGVVEAERKDFWPGDDKDATDRAAKLHSSASYHLPMILLLLEHQQAGALQVGAGVTRDRECGSAFFRPSRSAAISFACCPYCWRRGTARAMATPTHLTR